MKVRDPKVPRNGKSAKFIYKDYVSFYVDARAAGRGRPRGSTVEKAKAKGKPLAKELAEEGWVAIELSPEERRMYVSAAETLKPFGLKVDEAARKLAKILEKLNGDSFDKVHEAYSAGRQNLKVDGITGEIYKLYLHEQDEVRGNSSCRSQYL